MRARARACARIREGPVGHDVHGEAEGEGKRMLDVPKVDDGDGDAEVPETEAVQPERVALVGRAAGVVVVLEGPKVAEHDPRGATQRAGL